MVPSGAAEDDALEAGELFDGVFGEEDLGLDVGLADLGGDEVGVLAAEVDDGDGVVRGGGGGAGGGRGAPGRLCLGGGEGTHLWSLAKNLF